MYISLNVGTDEYYSGALPIKKLPPLNSTADWLVWEMIGHSSHNKITGFNLGYPLSANQHWFCILSYPTIRTNCLQVHYSYRWKKGYEFQQGIPRTLRARLTDQFVNFPMFRLCETSECQPLTYKEVKWPTMSYTEITLWLCTTKILPLNSTWKTQIIILSTKTFCLLYVQRVQWLGVLLSCTSLLRYSGELVHTVSDKSMICISQSIFDNLHYALCKDNSTIKYEYLCTMSNRQVRDIKTHIPHHNHTASSMWMTIKTYLTHIPYT